MTGAYTPTLHIEAAFGNGPYDTLTGTEWTDFTDRLIRATLPRGSRNSELDTFSAGTATIELDDSGPSGRDLDPLNDSGDYAGLLVPDVPIRAFASLPGTTDTFTGTDGATPTGWTDVSASGAGASAQINANRYRFVSGTTTYGYARARRSTATTLHFDISCTLTIAALSEQYARISVRGATTFTGFALNSCYAVEADLGSNELTIYRVDDAGAATEIATGPVTWTVATWNVRIRCLGSEIAAKAWTGATEPADWTSGAADATHTGTALALGFSGGNNTTSDTIYFDDLTVTPLYPRWHGFVDDWEPQWSKSLGVCRVTATDGFKPLSRHTLPGSVYEATVLAAGPSLYARLDESGPIAADLSTNRFDGEYRSSGITQSADVVVPLTAGSVEIRTINGYAVRWGSIARQTTTEGGFEVWVETDQNFDDYAAGHYMIFHQPGPATFPAPSVDIRGVAYQPEGTTAAIPAPELHLEVRTPTVYVHWVYSSPRLDDGQPHHVAFNSGASSQYLLVDGVEQTALTFSAGALANLPAADLYVGAPRGDLLAWPGRVAHFVAYDEQLVLADALAHYTAAVTAWDLDSIGARVTRILDLIGWPSARRAVDTGETAVGPANLANRKALDYLQAVAASEYGARLFTDETGRVVLHDGSRFQRETVETTPQAVFSDDGAAGSVLYEPSIRFRRSFREVVDHAVVTRDGGSAQTATKTGVTDPVASRSVTGLLLRDDRQSRGYAERIVARHGEPRTRVSAWRTQPEVDCRSGTDWSTVLGLGIGDRVTVEGTPGNVGAQLALDVHLDAITDVIEPETWHIDFAGSPADLTNYFTWDGNGATQGWDEGVWR